MLKCILFATIVSFLAQTSSMSKRYWVCVLRLKVNMSCSSSPGRYQTWVLCSWTCRSTVKGLKRSFPECTEPKVHWAQFWSLPPGVEIIAFCVFVFVFLHLKHGISSRTQLTDFFKGWNKLKYMKCWEQWLTHSKCCVNVYYHIALNSVLCFSLMHFIFLRLDLYLTTSFSVPRQLVKKSKFC